MGPKGRKIKKIEQDLALYIMVLVPILLILVFSYLPMSGILLAFKDVKLNRSLPENILFGDWVGFKYFRMFLNDLFFWNIFRNTILVSVLTLAFGFPAPILLALMLNEVRNDKFKRVTQTISYLPHFLSVVVIVGLMMQILSPSTGVVNSMITALGGKPIYFMTKPEWFRPLYVLSDIWQGIGWGSIIYIAAIAGLDPQLYEAASIDGAGRYRKMVHITLPGIMPTIIILFLMSIGSVLQVSFEKILIMQGNQGLTKSTSEVLDTFVYARGIKGSQHSYATAVGLFKSVIGFSLLTFANYLSRKHTETSLW